MSIELGKPLEARKLKVKHRVTSTGSKWWLVNTRPAIWTTSKSRACRLHEEIEELQGEPTETWRIVVESWFHEGIRDASSELAASCESWPWFHANDCWHRAWCPPATIFGKAKCLFQRLQGKTRSARRLKKTSTYSYYDVLWNQVVAALHFNVTIQISIAFNPLPECSTRNWWKCRVNWTHTSSSMPTLH